MVVGIVKGQSLRLAYGVCEWCMVLAEQALSVLKLVFHYTVPVDANLASALCSILAPPLPLFNASVDDKGG